ncbi:ribonuclease H-like domain-containing protein [Tanacetum coccineum]
MASPQASICKPSKIPKFIIIPPKQLFIDLTKEDTTTPSLKFQVSSPSPPNSPSKTPSIKDTSSSSIDYTPKSPTLLSSPSTNSLTQSIRDPAQHTVATLSVQATTLPHAFTVLLQCDSTRDLYPVTSPSPIPHAFLVSQHTWHQCLGHPGSEVLRRLVSSNFISCTKEKPPVLCHACQLGKHVRLTFLRSSTVISSCFDIIHSDVWTSLILRLLGFKYYYLADGSLSRYKVRLVANGSTQLEGIDVDETFSPVVKPSTIRTVLSLATSRHWPVHQLDVKNDFLHGDLTKIVYMHQPSGFRDSQHPDYVFLLQRSLYGLKQAPRAWFQRFASYITRIPVSQDSSGMFLSQKKYAVEIIERAHMLTCNPSRTPIDTESKLGVDGDPVCLYMHDPQEPHFSALKRILSATAEYRGVANAVVETCWLHNLLRELHTLLSSATIVYCDNVCAVYLSCNPVQHQRTKHIEIDIHIVRDLVAAGQVLVLHVPSRYQFADIFTKGLPSALFEEFWSSLSVRCPSAATAEEC